MGLVAYIASPVGGLYKICEDENKAKKEIARIAEHYCSIAKRKGFIPISTPIAFLNVYEEKTEREIALSACLKLLERCEVFVYNSRDLKISSGVNLELETARKMGLKIFDISSDIEID